MSTRCVAVIGGGAAGVFAAIACAEASPSDRVIVLEKGPQFLTKVRISGGGRCNVTHACFDPRELSTCYPRGGAALVGPFGRFAPNQTIEWFESRGVKLKVEPDGRMFPQSDSSSAIVDCLLGAARAAHVELATGKEVGGVTACGRGFELTIPAGARLQCDRLMLATGGCRSATAGQLPVSLGHTLVPPVPSLFAFVMEDAWLQGLAGISLQTVEVSVPGMKLRARGAVVMTHTGMSGPAILRLSAWGARPMHRAGYHFLIRVNWVPGLRLESVLQELASRRKRQAARLVVNTPVQPLAARLWEELVGCAGIPRATRWADLSRAALHRLGQQLCCTELRVIGKSLNKEEFVTCGGVALAEVDFRTMESRLCPGLYFGGELLDIDGVTGGFNFQAAWTTGWIAGRAMSR